jgi:hypothetical protein
LIRFPIAFEDISFWRQQAPPVLMCMGFPILQRMLEQLPEELYENLLDLEWDIYQIRSQIDVIKETQRQFFEQNLNFFHSYQRVYEQLEENVQKIIVEGAHNIYQQMVHAVMSNNLLKVSILLRYGADIHTLDTRGRGYVYLATSSKMIRLLVRYGIDINQLSPSGETALHHVAHADAARELLRSGLNVMARNNSQSTPLHYSMDPQITTLLLSHGADPNALNYYGHTPLHLVASRGIWEIACILLDAGCDLKITGRDNKTAVSLSPSPLFSPFALDHTL